MKLYIPEIGDQFVLSKDWTFDLYYERRNESLLKKINIDFKWNYNQPMAKYPITLTKGTSLKVDRIYIRKGLTEFSSLTFFIGSGEWKGCRFWAKLSDVNNIEFDEVQVSLAIKVSFSRSVSYSQNDKIITQSSVHNWIRNNSSEIICKVNTKPIIKIKPIVQYRNLTDEECKTLNATQRHYYNYTTKDIRITKYSLIASFNDQIIGEASTTATLSKKIKDFVAKNPQLISK